MVNRTLKGISADFQLLRPIDEKLAGVVKFKKLNGGGAELSPMPMIYNPCKVFMQYFGEPVKKMLENAGIKRQCPIQPASMKYKLIVERMGTCVGPEYSDVESPFTNIKFVKINRTSRSISPDFYLRRPIDEKVGGIIKFKKLSGGVTQEVPLLPMVNNPCKLFMHYFQAQLSKLLENAGIKNPSQCPIPPGNYSLKNYVVDDASSKTTIMLPLTGRFMLRTMLMDIATKKIIVCVETLSEHVQE